jgi:putative spermidine/putrescine transport system permease protein
MKPLPVFASKTDYLGHYIFVAICTFIFIFLITPVLIIIPLSFNAEPYFTFTQGMLSFDPSAFSTRWYEDIIYNGMVDPNGVKDWWNDMWNNAQWIRSARNSFFIATMSAVIATILGTIAALGLSRSEMPYRALITSLLISPMIVPLVITASGMFFFYSSINLAKTFTGLILAHVTLGIPFVIITVTATLSGFDRNLIKASQSLGAHSWTTFRRVIMPLIMPGMISGALFAFITSLDEIVAVIFLADVEQRTIPRQMFSGIREQISPTILAVASVLVLISIILLTVMELLRRRSERLRGVTPG